MLATHTPSRQAPRAPELRLRLGSIKDVMAAHPAFSEQSLRALIFNAKENGLAPHIHRVGRRVFIDLVGFEKWVLSQ